VTAPLAPLAAGFALGASLIVAIGAQNAVVLRRGLERRHVAAVVTVCVACDWALIALGAVGFGSVVARFPIVTAVAAWAGAAFLALVGALSLRSALAPGALEAEDAGALEADADASRRGGVWGVVVATLAVSLLNPHVYLDTVVLLGSVAAQYPMPARAYFAAGAMGASLVWFAGLGFGARLLAPLFRRPVAWRVLDFVIAGVMWWIAAELVLGQLR